MNKPCVLLLLFGGELVYTAIIAAINMYFTDIAFQALPILLLWLVLWIPLMLLAAMPIMAVKRGLDEWYDVKAWQFVLCGPTPPMLASFVVLCAFGGTDNERLFRALFMGVATATFFIIRSTVPKRDTSYYND